MRPLNRREKAFLSRLEKERQKALNRSFLEGAGQLLGFSSGFWKGFRAQGQGAKILLPPPIGSLYPPETPLREARRRGWEGAWAFFEESGYDFLLFFCQEAEALLEEMKASLEPKEVGGLVASFEEAMVRGYALGRYTFRPFLFLEGP